MKLHEYIDQKLQDAYNEGWNHACDAWADSGPLTPDSRTDTKYTGDRRESFLAGWRDSIDNILLKRVK